MVTLRRDILVAVHLFMAHCFSCGQGCTQECAWVHVRQMLPLGMLPKGKQFQNHSFTMYLKNGDKVGPQSLKKTRLIFFCDTKWPWYPLEDREHWPVEGPLNYNIVYN